MLLIQKMIRLFGGYVKVRVEGYSAERFFKSLQLPADRRMGTGIQTEFV